MSLFGSLWTGASGMNAQSKSTAMISNNIANLNSTGFKRSEAAFYDMVTTTNVNSRYSPGVVTATRVQRVDQQGQIQQTVSSLDAGISGNGFFAVKRAPDDAMDFYYTRNGIFGEFPVDSGTPDEPFVYLRNAPGFYLYGWPLDAEGALPANSTDFTSLVPVDISLYDNAFLTTTIAELEINLDASQTSIDPHAASGGPQTLPASNLPVHFTRSFNVIDGAGNSRQITTEYRKIAGPMAHFTTGVGSEMDMGTAFIPTASTGVTPNINVGDQFQIQVGGGATETYTFVAEATGDDIATNQIATVRGLINAINAHGGGGQLVGSLTPAGRILVQAANPTATVTVSDVIGNPATGAGTLSIVPDPVDLDYTFAPEASLTANGPANPNQTDFPDFADTATPNVHNWWEMRVLIRDPAQANDPAAPLVEIRKGLINFDSFGALNALPDTNGDTLIDIATVPVDFDSSAVGEESGFTIEMGGFTQFAGNYNVLTVEQNGIPQGTRRGAEITREGYVRALFDNGLTRNIYQLPLVTFVNPNGLSDISGTAFAETEESGSGTLEVADSNGAGVFNPASVENSNVDLGDEFARLIVSQRAYGASAQIIRTVDEMTNRLANLRQ